MPPDAASPLARAGRLWRTARHLRPVQVYGRAWFRLHRPRPDFALPPALATPAGPWASPARRARSLVAHGVFRLLNEEADVAQTGWDDPAREKLWRYNQHYFDDLNAEGAEARADWHRALLLDWIAANPPGRGTGWEPYPISLRIVNWIKWALSGHQLPPEAVASLAVQARWLAQRLEWHLLGNHLFANAKALLFAGLWFGGPEAARWRRTALAILLRELPEQVLPDGGQFELSPMYHALAVEDVLDILNIARARDPGSDDDLDRAAADCRARLPAMLGWLATLSHPDGRIAFFNDATFGVAPENAELFAYAVRLGVPAPVAPDVPALRLPQSGYARLRAGEAVLLADLAAIGPDYLPGHAHADTLSFELSLGTQRVVVNSGTSVYGTGAERLRQRGTAAHSTVTLDGRNSSEVWGGFRVGRRARPLEVRTGAKVGDAWAEGAHDGYAHLPGHPLHRRRWDLSPTGLRVADRLSDQGALARYHLHPDIRPAQDGPGEGHLLLPDGRRLRWTAEAGGPARLEPSSWHPEFGRSHPSTCLVLPLAGGQATLHLTWG